MEQLARQLSYSAGRPVMDRTGLTGFFVYTLDWFPANRIPPADLDPAKGPMEKLVIDRAEKPSEN